MTDDETQRRTDSEQKEAFERLKKSRSDASETQRMFQLSGVGFEFIVAVGGFAALGWWLDGKFGKSPIFTITGVAFGFALGLYRLVKFAQKTMK